MKVENEPTGSVDPRAFKETLAPPKTWSVVAAFDEFVARSRVEKLQSDPIEKRDFTLIIEKRKKERKGKERKKKML